jgi:hypothetical protein
MSQAAQTPSRANSSFEEISDGSAVISNGQSRECPEFLQMMTVLLPE